MNRREALMKGLGSIGALAAVGGIGRVAKAVCAEATPLQPEGPFYPIHDQLDKDNDLTYVRGKTQRAKGQVIYVTGTVTDEACAPVSGVLVEIWQACETGRYNHADDSNPAALDPNFQYWGRAITDQSGKYLFKTVIPGQYQADSDWIRPPHIHYKVTKKGYEELITQMYFRGNALNDRDLLLNKLPLADRERLIVNLVSAGSGYEPSALTGRFDLVIRKP